MGPIDQFIPDDGHQLVLAFVELIHAHTIYSRCSGVSLNSLLRLDQSSRFLDPFHHVRLFARLLLRNVSANRGCRDKRDLR